MTASRYDIRSYAFDPKSTYFLDTNIWFFVYGPAAPTDRRVRLYSDAVTRLRRAGAVALIDALVVSEFANAWARFEYRRINASIDFKTFRNGAAFRVTASQIVVSLRSILSFAKPTGTAFANIDLALVLTSFENGGSDFNDLLIVETCRAKSCLLVTDDADMKRRDVAIVTANRALLAP